MAITLICLTYAGILAYDTKYFQWLTKGMIVTCGLLGIIIKLAEYRGLIG